MGRIRTAQELPDGWDVVQSSSLQPLDHIAARQDDYRVAIFADLLVRLAIEVRGSDQDAKLTVPLEPWRGRPWRHPLPGVKSPPEEP